MAAIATVELNVNVLSSDSQALAISESRRIRWAPGTAGNGKRESVSLTGSSTFTALSPPSGATGLLLILPNTAASLTLKGVTGDGAGVSIVPASGYNGLPVLMPLSTASIGILNDGSTITAECVWL